MSAPTLRLHASPTSPFVRVVSVALIELGLADRVERVAARGDPLDPGTMPVALNPLGKIPTLERPEGPALYDSRVILRYLDDLSRDGAGGALYPSRPRLWETLTLEALGIGLAEAAALMVYETRLRPEGMRLQPWVEGQWRKVERGLDALEARWLAHLAGPLDAGQIAVGCALGYLDFRHGARGWRGGRPGLAAWEARFAARPSMAATVPVG